MTPAEAYIRAERNKRAADDPARRWFVGWLTGYRIGQREAVDAFIRDELPRLLYEALKATEVGCWANQRKYVRFSEEDDKYHHADADALAAKIAESRK